jgi:ribonuclease HI
MSTPALGLSRPASSQRTGRKRKDIQKDTDLADLVPRKKPATTTVHICECKKTAVLRVVKKANANQGREFYCCPSSSCKYFEFKNGRPLAITKARKIADSIAVRLDTIIMYTDGSCKGNVNVAVTKPPAGWGVVVLKNGDGGVDASAELVAELYGKVEVNVTSSAYMGAEVTSNNTAELSAIGHALQYLLDSYTSGNIPHAVIRYDSEYAAGSVLGQMNGTKNTRLITHIRGLLALVRQRQSTDDKIQFSKVKGHSSHRWNDRVDFLAKKGCTL